MDVGAAPGGPHGGAGRFLYHRVEDGAVHPDFLLPVDGLPVHPVVDSQGWPDELHPADEPPRFLLTPGHHRLYGRPPLPAVPPHCSSAFLRELNGGAGGLHPGPPGDGYELLLSHVEASPLLRVHPLGRVAHEGVGVPDVPEARPVVLHGDHHPLLQGLHRDPAGGGLLVEDVLHQLLDELLRLPVLVELPHPQGVDVEPFGVEFLFRRHASPPAAAPAGRLPVWGAAGFSTGAAPPLLLDSRRASTF